MSKLLIQSLKREFSRLVVEKMAFRNMSPSDSFPLHIAAQHPDFNQHLIWSRPEHESTTIEQVDLLLRESISDEAVLSSIVEKNTGKWIGLLKITAYKDSVRFGLWLHPDYWNKRFAYIAILAAVDVVFERTELPIVFARVKKDYTLMERIVKSVGGTYLHPDSVIRDDGSLMEDSVWQLFKSDWLALKRNTDWYQY